MIKCVVFLLIIYLVLILLNSNSCENYSGLDIQENAIPCYEAINYNNLDTNRVYDPNNINYNDYNNEIDYKISNDYTGIVNSVLPMPPKN
jgi:hypothetical protein